MPQTRPQRDFPVARSGFIHLPRSGIALRVETQSVLEAADSKSKRYSQRQFIRFVVSAHRVAGESVEEQPFHTIIQKMGLNAKALTIRNPSIHLNLAIVLTPTASRPKAEVQWKNARGVMETVHSHFHEVLRESGAKKRI